MKERDRLFFVSKKFGIEDDINNYKRLRNDIVDELRRCKREHNDNNIDANKNNGKILWRELKELIGSKKTQSNIESIECDNKIIYDNLVISNEFNHYFIDSIEKIVYEIGFDQLKDVVSDNSNNQKWDSFDRVYVNDLDKIIQSLDNKKGFNNDVNSVNLKHLWNFDKNSILEIMNKSLESGVVPDCLKVSRIVPIQKIKDSIKLTDFRPINTLPVLEQVLESIVKSQLEKFIVENKILNEEQSGFRKEHSCETAMQCSLIDWRNYIDKGLYVGVVFIDFARAFETINRDKLLIILKELGIGGNVLNWFKSYLNNRKQVVQFNNCVSDQKIVKHGVPQGSKLGPLLFIIYINDVISLIKDQGIECKLFADDMKLYYSSKDEKEIECKLNTGLLKLSVWLKEHQLKINVKKTVFMMLHDVRKKYKMGSCKIKISNESIVEVSETKYLGVIIDNNLTFQNHLIETGKKIAKKLNIIYRLNKSVSPWTKNTIYKAVIGPHFDYCASLMMNYNQRQLNVLQKIQNRAMRIVLGVNRYTRTSEMLAALGWMSVSQLMVYRCCILIHKIKIGLAPSYLVNKISFVGEYHDYNTRQRNEVQIKFTRTHTAEKSLIYRGFVWYNRLPKTTKNEKRLKIFKIDLRNFVKENYLRNRNSWLKGTCFRIAWTTRSPSNVPKKTSKMFRGLVFTSFVIFSWTDVLTGSITTSNTFNITLMIKNNLNTAVNPCDNSYRFVCGSSRRFAPKLDIILYTDLVTVRLTDLIEEGTVFKGIRPFQLIDDVYKTCKSNAAIGEQAVKSLFHVLEQLGGWPLLQGSQWKTKNYNLTDVTLRSKLLGISVNPFLTIEPVVVSESARGTTIFSVSIDPPEFNRSITNGWDPLLVAYSTYLKKVCKLIGCQKMYSDEFKDIVDLEWKLSEIYHRRNFMKNLTYKELTENYPSVLWSKLFYSLYPISNEQLNISNMTFFVSTMLSDVIELLDKTDPRVLYNYANWKVFQHAIPYLTKDYQDLKREYCKTQECEDIPLDKCLKVVFKYLQPAVNLLYAKRYFTEEVDSLVSHMVANIKRQTKDLISKSSWMDQDTKKEHIDAIDNIPVIIGYAEKNSTDDEFVKYYEELEIDTSNFFQTLMNLEAFDSPRRFYSTNSLGPRNFINPLLTTASFLGGKLYVPMNMLREPFFSVNYPMSVNYGFSGRAIAKALAKGILHRREPRSQAMKEKVACFSKQVANYTTQLPFETNLLVDEYLAFKISYQAYQSWLISVSGGSEPMIPELPYSDRQIFWMSSLQNGCKLPWNKEKMIEDKYFPFEFRKMIDLSNIPEFYDDFNCQSKPFLETHGPSCTLF
ncbi:uncharacterized protein LOC123263936 [Cotesia glomerata]|uniref:uncharacterized protein LOC123263936 n=1 Tax=Cotesia glomerata TaxID=32391 RepID=UPI001D003C42|nr:uncharacterized protein LOC123263936 [Cotesia glomerata]